jgi:hypothetical protein
LLNTSFFCIFAKTHNMDLSQLLQQTAGGAATGTAVEPGWGTLIGAGAGLGMGILGQANQTKSSASR